MRPTSSRSPATSCRRSKLREARSPGSRRIRWQNDTPLSGGVSFFYVRVAGRGRPGTASLVPLVPLVPCGPALDTGEIRVGVRRRVGALGFPERLAEAFHDRVMGVVARAEPCRKALVRGANTGRLVDGKLLADGKVHRKMQERVRLAALGRVMLGTRAVCVGERGMVLRVLDDPVGGDGFEWRQDFPGALFAPGFGEKAADFVTAGIEHRGRPDGECVAGLGRLRRVGGEGRQFVAGLLPGTPKAPRPTSASHLRRRGLLLELA
ncbi:protein of unknown function [Paraburkholderia kururiensis]